jgi:hypothetical protein
MDSDSHHGGGGAYAKLPADFTDCTFVDNGSTGARR